MFYFQENEDKIIEELNEYGLTIKVEKISESNRYYYIYHENIIICSPTTIFELETFLKGIRYAKNRSSQLAI